MSSVIGVIQARAGSSRLPRKVLRPLAGRPVLGWVVRAVQQVQGLSEVVVATTTDPRDDEVAALAADLGVDVVRGSEDDVLGRFVQVLDHKPADAVARFTADCPLLDPAVASLVVGAWRAAPDLEHVSTVNPRCLPRGMDAEVASAAALRALDRELTDPARAFHRTHVTSALYAGDASHRVVGVVLHPGADDLRVTLDTEQDWALLEAVVDRLGDRPPAWRDVVALLRSEPDLVALNSSVVQKALEDG